MKSILTVLGTFTFSLFLEGFTRLIILFYNKSEFVYWGVSSLPSPSWIIVIYISVLVISWLCGMLTITISGFSPLKHLIALGFIFMLWRLNEILQTFDSEPLWYLFTIPLCSLAGIYLAYLTNKHSNAETVSTEPDLN